MSPILSSDNTSRFILGTHKLGDIRLNLSDTYLIKLIEEANHSGFLNLDTAPIYGLGLADKLLSNLISSFSFDSTVVVDSKIGLHRMSNTCNSVFLSYEIDLINDQISQILNSYSGHLRYIYLHYPPSDLRVLYPILEILNQLVSEGLIEGSGLSNFSYAQIRNLFDFTDISSIQLYFAPFRSHYPFTEILSILQFASQNMIHCSSYGTLSGIHHNKSNYTPGFNETHISNLSLLFSQPLTLGFDQILTSITKTYHLECLKHLTHKKLSYSNLLNQFSSSPFTLSPLKF